jgi:hypothetical protein
MLEYLVDFFLKGKGLVPSDVPTKNETPHTSPPGSDGAKNKGIVAQNEAPTKFDSTQKGDFNYTEQQQAQEKAFYASDDFAQFARIF